MSESEIVDLEGNTEVSDDDNGVDEEPDLWHTLAIFRDVSKNKNLQIWFLFNLFCKAACSINNNVAEVYLTNDLGFPKENLSIIKVVCTPLNIMFAFVSGYLSSS